MCENLRGQVAAFSALNPAVYAVSLTTVKKISLRIAKGAKGIYKKGTS